MKKNKIFAGLTIFAIVLAYGCKKDDNGSGDQPLEISTTFLNPNIVIFSHNHIGEGIASWDFGNGKTSDQDIDTIAYPFAGTYSVSLSVFTSSGELVATESVVITQSDPSLIELTEMEILLCGGADAANGKTWVWARYVPQHMMKGQYDPWQWWWGAASNEKAAFNLYDDLMIFKAVNYEFVLENNDTTYVNVDYLGEFGVEGTEDTPVYYDVSEETFSWAIEERADGDYLSFTGGGFMSYYLGVSEYKIEELTENELTLSVIINNVLWQFLFMTEGYDHPDAVDPNVNENLSPATSVSQLTDDFETDADILWLFQAEGGGGSGDDEFANPFQEGINVSATVYEYKKGAWEYSNASMELDFTIDLNTHDKVRMKVYFPSSNTYTAEGLKQKAAVKFQRWQEAGNAWQTQAEVIQEDVLLDTWTELTFDFTSISVPAERMSEYYNKIVIQFGDEGHTEDGTFYFDDFEVLAK